ncbi:hypothetical protein C7C45_11760 [Micromonospora arborensis]|uniref:Uncharacterized protein n=2 Tax=Micromonospora arborensis TaxID=2116518 RepID=A0A318NVS1_9ACTN|nr:hypothetical protein [Micromonospora arborensis]PYC71089.1 hypothetical protein C7C45_11760 [Micromonospora arborensis]
MTVDEELSRALAELSGTLTPQPDPYGRARARYRRSRQRRLGGLALALVVSVGGAAFAIADPGRTTQPPPADSTESSAPVVAWSDKLLQSPPRGVVGQDSGYVRQLSELLLAAQRRGDIPRMDVPVTAVKVLFVDDVGGQRIALAAFVRDQPDPATGWPSTAMWLSADEGASAEELVSTNAVRGVSDGLEPYESLALGDPSGPGKVIHVAIAPAGCVFLSSPLPNGTAFQWTPEPTGSYLIRTPKTQRPEWWRVDCGAVTRKMIPGPGSLLPDSITDAQLATAMSRVRGSVPEQRARLMVSEYAKSRGYQLAALPSVVWGGHATGLPARSTGGSPAADASLESGEATILAAPAAGGGWIGQVTIDLDRPRLNGVIGTGASFVVTADPTDPAGVLAVSIDSDNIGDEGERTLLVVTPAAATRVRVAQDGREVATAAVSGAGAVVPVPHSMTGLVVEALDASGRTLASGQVAGDGAASTLETDTWNQD